MKELIENFVNNISDMVKKVQEIINNTTKEIKPFFVLVENFVNNISKEYGNEAFKFIYNKDTFDASKDSVYYGGPFWDNKEIEAIFTSFISGKWLSAGESVFKFEREFSKKFNIENSLMVNSGSSANLVMVAALKKYFNWANDSEIIVSCVGFPTTINSIIQNNLTPRFVDINYDDLNWDLSQVENSINDNTVAVFCSPVLGNPGNFGRLIEICEQYNIKLILDNCDSLGSTYDGKYLNEYSVASSCSFYPAHHITTIEGGMVSSNISEIIDIARSFAWWGRDCYCSGAQNLLCNGMCKKRFDTWLPNYANTVDHKYVYTTIGYNLKPIDCLGAIGSVQLSKFDKIHELRIINKTLISDILHKIDGVRIIHDSDNCSTSWFGVPIICDSPDLKRKLVAHLEKNRIQTRNYFAGNVLLHPAYSDIDDYSKYTEANKVLDNVFFLGCSPTINLNMIDYISTVIDNFDDK